MFISHDFQNDFELRAFQNEGEWFVSVVDTGEPTFEDKVLGAPDDETNLDIKATYALCPSPGQKIALIALIMLQKIKHETTGAVDLFCTHALRMVLNNAKTITHYNVAGSIMRHGDNDNPNAHPIGMLIDAFGNMEVENLRTGIFGALINATKALAEKIRGQL